MDIPIRTGDYVSAMRQLDVVQQKLKDIGTLAGKWVLEVEKHIKQGEDGFSITLLLIKNDGSGFRVNLAPKDVEYYSNDVHSLVAKLTDDVIEKLYRDQIRETLTPAVSLALRNAMTMKDKS